MDELVYAKWTSRYIQMSVKKKGKTMTIVTEDGEELAAKGQNEFGLVWVTFWLGRTFLDMYQLSFFLSLFSRTAAYNHFSPSNDDLMRRLWQSVSDSSYRHGA